MCLQTSSGSNSATLTLTFAKQIKSVKIKAQAYFKVFMKSWGLEDGQDPYPVYSIDADTTIEVNGQSWELPSCEYNDNYEIVSMPAIDEKTFTVSSNKLVIDDTVMTGRTYIHCIELTF